MNKLLMSLFATAFIAAIIVAHSSGMWKSIEQLYYYNEHVDFVVYSDGSFQDIDAVDISFRGITVDMEDSYLLVKNRSKEPKEFLFVLSFSYEDGTENRTAITRVELDAEMSVSYILNLHGVDQIIMEYTP